MLSSQKSAMLKLSTNTHSAQSWLSFKSLRNRYHNLILIAKKKFFSNLVSKSSAIPRRLWQTVNKLLHHKSTSPLPTSCSSVPLPDRFASFFTDKISKLHLSLSLSLSSHPAIASPHCHSPPALPPDFSTFRPASESKVSKILFSCPNKRSESDILSPPGSLNNVLQFSFLQLPTLPISLSAPVINSIQFSNNQSYLPF